MIALTILAVSALANLFLGWVVLLRSSRRPVYVWYAILSTITVFWITLNIFTGLLESVWIFRLTYTVGAVLPFVSYIWYKSFQKHRINSTKQKITLILLALLTTFFSLIPLVNGLIVKEAESFFLGGISGELGPLYPLWALFVFSLITFTLGLIIRDYWNSSGIKKLQIRYILLGFFGFALIPIVVSIILPFFGILNLTWLDSFGSVPLVVAIGYAIVRYRFLDIRVIIARTIAFGLIVTLLVVIYAIFSSFIAIFFENLVGTKSTIIVSIIVAVLVAIGYQPIRTSIERVTNRFLFKKTYDPDKLLSEISTVTSSILDLKHLLTSIAKTLDSAFHAQSIGVALLDNKNKLNILYNEGLPEEKAGQLVNYPDVVKILHKELKTVSGMLVIDEMKTQYENGDFQPVSPELLLALHENDIALIVPLFVKEQLIGVLSLGGKKSGDPYSSQDLSVLKIISGQAAIAIENARLYDELRDFNIKLEDEVRRKTAQLRKANTELKQLDEAKSEFISIASHQLRTPLTIIKGYISMMQEGSFGPVPEVIMNNLKKVYISNERLIALVENLLDISRIESGRQDFDWKNINLENLAATVVENLTQSAKVKGLKLFFHKPETATPKVTADEGKIHEVMMNFVDNAIKYTEKGEINVFVRSEPEKDAVTFCVADTGKGISSDAQAMLFKKFSRGKGSFRMHTEGLGLGLYVAKMMLDAHKGKIWVESDGEGKGAQFCFSLSTKLNTKELEKQLPEKKFGSKVPAKKVDN